MSGYTHLTWGGFVFERSTVPLDSRQHSIQWRLASQPHLGFQSGWQFMGRGQDRMVVKGKMAPASQIGQRSSLAELEALAEKGDPRPITFSPTGKSPGNYFLQSIDTGDEQMLEGYGFVVNVTLTLVRDRDD